MFLLRLAGFYIKSLGIYFGNLNKNVDKKYTCKFALFTPYFTKNKTYYVYNYCCTNFVIQRLLYAMRNVLFSHVKNCVLKIISGVLFLSSKVKTNMKERCSID